jgi:hypothetical protein
METAGRPSWRNSPARPEPLLAYGTGGGLMFVAVETTFCTVLGALETTFCAVEVIC